MSFGRKILEKYGYVNGNGLGKHENGIIEPIKATLKFDNAGLGDDGPVREDHWWERVFNEASSNVNVERSENGKISCNLIDEAGVEITNKCYSLKKLKESNEKLTYGNFLKSATLLANVGKEEELAGHLSTADIEIKPLSVLSDEDLFKACGGRTAHKGARHGLNLSGKLQRIAEQEKLLLEKMKRTANKHDVFREPTKGVEPSSKKQKKNPLAELNSSKDDTSDDNLLPVDMESDYILKASRKRKKRDRQTELQLVTQISTIELATDTKLVNVVEREEVPTEHEEDEPQRDGTPMRKKKKPKRVADKLADFIEESDQQETPKRKKKKGKRRLSEDDEVMGAEKYLKNQKKSKKVKLNDSYEASSDETDIVSQINAEQEAARQLTKGKKNNRKSQKEKKKSSTKEKNRAKKTADRLATAL